MKRNCTIIWWRKYFCLGDCSSDCCSCNKVRIAVQGISLRWEEPPGSSVRWCSSTSPAQGSLLPRIYHSPASTIPGALANDSEKSLLAPSLILSSHATPPSMPIQAFRSASKQGEKNFSTWVQGAPVVRQDMSLKSVDEKCCVRMRIFLLLYNPQGQNLK